MNHLLKTTDFLTIYSLFEFWHWLKSVKDLIRLSRALIHEFYANFGYELSIDSNKQKVYVRGNRITFNANVVKNALELPDVDMIDYLDKLDLGVVVIELFGGSISS